MKAYLVEIAPMVRVEVEDNATEEQIIEAAIEKMRKDPYEYIHPTHCTEVTPDEECPYMNIKKYLDNEEQTENGYVYKREDYDTAPENEIVYIGEYDLGELQRLCDDGTDLTDEEMLEQGIGDTKATIRRTIKDYYPNATDEWIDKHELIADIIQSCTWESPATMIDQMGNWDIWDDYPEE